jgi:SpoVK/Ycf46/Vps4 family AAA+-type ATPase
MAESYQLSEDFVVLARIALTGRSQDIQLLIHRASKKYREALPKMTEALVSLLQESPSRSSPLRKQADTPMPVDIDSRLQLLRVETLESEQAPILSVENESHLKQILSERESLSSLFKLGLHPSKSILFTGPPGVGKTLAAKWIAHKLGRPLLVLDLAAVMSSFLGRTGNNIRYVLDYAKNTECVLLLDELDAIAKRRDDVSEIGELKRLVTVLLQEIDDWPPTGLLIAATNHPDLLDPAVWRRFEVVLDFGKPNQEQIETLVKRLIGTQVENIDKWSKLLSAVFSGKSYSEVERQITMIRKISAITDKPLAEIIPSLIDKSNSLTRAERFRLAVLLADTGIVSQRQAHEITGVSRDTIRKHRDKSIAETKKKVGKSGARPKSAPLKKLFRKK